MAESPAPSNASVLLADDDPDLVAVLALAFRASGLQVTTAGDGSAALEALESGRFDVLVLDILMPGATGWEVLARALEGTAAGSPLPRAILMTGFNQEYVVDMRLLQQEGVAAMLLKPFPATTLIEEIRRALSLPPQVAQPRAPQAAPA